MSTEKMKYIINQYFDNEMEKAKEINLFSQLSQDEEAREYFKKMTLIKSSISESMVEFPDELERRIYHSIRTMQTGNEKPNFIKHNIIPAFSYGIAVVLLVISLFFFQQSMQYREKLDTTIWQVNQQNQMMQMLFNSLPAAEVNTELKDVVIVKPTI